LIKQVVKKEAELGRKLNDSHEAQAVKHWTLKAVRGTVQADILKEDQGQNTCIFSIQFALKMMGDIQEVTLFKKECEEFLLGQYLWLPYRRSRRQSDFSQLAFTLSNGFTFVEYYLSRGTQDR
jgi:methylmalonyl-CoA mutase